MQRSRTADRDYHSGNLSAEVLILERPVLESQLQEVLEHPPARGWPADAQGLANRIKRHGNQWFTFLSYPEVKPDHHDPERALRPIVIHRKVSGGARSDWGAQLVAQMFSFLETMRWHDHDPIASPHKNPDQTGQAWTNRPRISTSFEYIGTNLGRFVLLNQSLTTLTSRKPVRFGLV